MVDAGRRNVLGILIDAVDYDAAVERIITAAKDGRPYSVSALAVHGVMTGVLDEAHRRRLNEFDLVAPDGQPVRWALNLLHGVKLRERVYGPTLMLNVCRRAADDGVPIFLFGGKQELLDKLAAKLTAKFPALIIAGTRPSQFRKVTPEEAAATAAAIRDSGAKITFVGLGCPRQEVWTFEMRELLPMPLLAVGAAFNFHAGELDQAPPWLQARGLEWFYRFVKEPRRLWQRYVLLNPLYVTLLTCQWLRLYSPQPNLDQPSPERIGYG